MGSFSLQVIYYRIYSDFKLDKISYDLSISNKPVVFRLTIIFLLKEGSQFMRFPHYQKYLKVMTVKEICNLLDANIACGNTGSETIVHEAFASDLMSDVLTLASENPLLITGLSNLQTIRTAEMSEIKVVVFARGKKVSEEMKNIASENQILLIETGFSVFKTCGILYQAGLKPIY
jgi:predicted transcriptional regulator